MRPYTNPNPRTNEAMILFRNDWMKYPGATIHYNTSNKSFLKVAEIYHRMGIENCAFHLTLLDPDLDGVDPFSPDLTLVQKGKIARECKLNFWYWLREVARVPEPGSLVAVSFGANRMNIALYWLFFNHVMTIVVILRQTGKTTTLSVLVEYLLNFGAMNTFINLLTKNESLKAETLSKVKALYEELPDYMNFSTKKDIFNSDEIQIKDFLNKFKGNLSSSSPKQAEKVGRGFTSPINIIDEAAFVENIAIAMGAMLMSGNKAREIAEANGNHFGTLIATTAGDTDDRDGGYIFSLVNAATVWDDRFVDATDNLDLQQLIFKNSPASKNKMSRPMVNITMSYRQLGLSEQWLQKTLQANISTPENIKRDIFNQWLSGSSSSPIPKEYIEVMRSNVNDNPISEFYHPHNYLLKWNITKEEFDDRSNHGHSFIIGVDTSDGSGGDDITFVMRDHAIGDVVCTAIFNEINLITLADFFVSFLLRYTNTVMIIERKSSAATIIDYIVQKLLAAGINPFTRLYNTIFQNKDAMVREYEEVSRARPHQEAIFTKYKKHLGFSTSGSGVTARSELYSATLIHMLKFTGHVLYDKTLIDQICALVVRNGRIDHPVGGNDDMVISSLISYWLLTKGMNLHLYGIDTTTLLRRNDVYLEEKYKTDDTEYEREELEVREQEFNDLMEEIKQETDPIIAAQLELKIRRLANDSNSSGNIISVEEMLETISREKRLKRYYRP